MDSSSLRSPSLANVRRQAIERLRKVYPPEEAQAITRALLKHFLPDWELDWLTSRGQAPFPPHRLAQWEAALSAAAQGYPVAYILGYTTFLGYRITMQPGVFIPRPETEEWIAWTIQYFPDRPPQRILEIGAGSGALLVALGKAFPQAALFALDKNPLAIHLTQKNCHTCPPPGKATSGTSLSATHPTFPMQTRKTSPPMCWPMSPTKPSSAKMWSFTKESAK
jgi:release factor glutamine methyltransferase